MNIILINDFIKNNLKESSISKNRLKIEILDIIKYYYPSNLFLLNIYIKDNILYICEDMYYESIPIKKSNLIIKLYKKIHCNNINLEIFDKSNNIIILFEFFTNNVYPFQAPSQIKINNYNYINLLQNINKTFLHKITNSSLCLCCKSIICSNNWTPTITLKSILNEIYTNIYLKKLYIYHIFIKIIVRKYLFEDAENIILKYG